MGNVFMSFWGFLDIIFSFINFLFESLFTAIPSTAIPFLIGIFCYSLLAIIIFFIEKQEQNKQFWLRLAYWFTVAIMGLFSIWRLGIIGMIERTVSMVSISEFVVNLIYIVIGGALVIVFWGKIRWVKKGTLATLWGIFLLLTFIVCPALGESVLSDSTLIQVILIASIFIVPNGLAQIQKGRNAMLNKNNEKEAEQNN